MNKLHIYALFSIDPEHLFSGYEESTTELETNDTWIYREVSEKDIMFIESNSEDVYDTIYYVAETNEIKHKRDMNLYNEIRKIKKRNIREKFLPAFDLWEKAVIRGREEDSPEIMQWYKDILDLKPDAFKDENIPDRIKYYLGGN